MDICVICEENVMKMFNFDCLLNQIGGFSKCLFVFWSFVLFEKMTVYSVQHLFFLLFPCKPGIPHTVNTATVMQTY